MCKPHKMKWAPKLSVKQAALQKAHEQEMRNDH